MFSSISAAFYHGMAPKAHRARLHYTSHPFYCGLRWKNLTSVRSHRQRTVAFFSSISPCTFPCFIVFDVVMVFLFVPIISFRVWPFLNFFAKTLYSRCPKSMEKRRRQLSLFRFSLCIRNKNYALNQYKVTVDVIVVSRNCRYTRKEIPSGHEIIVSSLRASNNKSRGTRVHPIEHNT